MTGKVYLVTGAAGFIGSRLATLLAEAGARIIGIDSINDAYDRRIKDHRIESWACSKAQRPLFLKGDIEDRDFLYELFRNDKFDAVFHLAARSGVRYSLENPSAYLQTNAQGTLNLLEEMKECGVRKMVLASTSSLYAGHPVPFREDLSVSRSFSPYAASKQAAEVLAYTYHHLHEIDVSILRYFTVYGPAGRPDMCIFRFIKWIDEGVPVQIIGDGHQSRDFTYVDDVVRGTIAAVKPVGSEVINLGGGKESVSLLDVIGRIETILNKRAKLDFIEPNPADIRETRADVSKAKRLLDWEAKIGLDEGLEESIGWYLRNKDWLKEVELG